MSIDLLLINQLSILFDYLDSKLLSAKRWVFYAALICTLNSLFWAFPSYQKIAADDIKVNGDLSFWKRINQQVEHPLTHFDYPPATHEAKVSFRLLAPLLAKFSPFESLNGRMGYLFFLQHIAGFLFFYYLTLFAFRYSQNRVLSLLFALSFSMTYLGHSFFYELYGFFDGMAFTLLLLSMYYYRKWFCVIPFFLAFWVDERAVIGSGLVYIFIVSQENNFSNPQEWKAILCRSIPFLAVYGIYFLLRKYMAVTYGLTVPIGSEHDAGLGLILQQIKGLPLATFLRFEGTWLIVFWGLIAMYYSNLGMMSYAYILIFAVIILISYCVWDVTRSLMYGFPFFLICTRYLLMFLPPRRSLLLMFAILLINFSTPSYKNHYFQFYWQVPLPVKVMYYLKG